MGKGGNMKKIIIAMAIVVFMSNCGNSPTQTQTDNWNIIGNCTVNINLNDSAKTFIVSRGYSARTCRQCDSLTKYWRAKYTGDTVTVGIFTEDDTTGTPFIDTL
jgi:hypothetical protein